MPCILGERRVLARRGGAGEKSDFLNSRKMEEPMHCPTCRRTMLSTSCQEIQDEKGAMTITRWRCNPCHETAEEIWVSADYCGADPRRIRYAVAAPDDRTVPARSFGRSRRGTPAHAVAC